MMNCDCWVFKVKEGKVAQVKQSVSNGTVYDLDIYTAYLT